MSARYVDGNSLFVMTLATRRLGLDLVLVVMLADGTTVLRGRAVVRKAWATSDNPFRLPGLLLGIRTLTPRSKEVFDRVRAAAARASTHRRVVPPSDAGTTSAPVFDSDAAFGAVETTLVGPPLSHTLKVEPSRADKEPTDASASHAALVAPLGRRATTRDHHPESIRIPAIPPMKVVIPDVTKPLTRSVPLVPAASVQGPADAPPSEPELDRNLDSISDGTVAAPTAVTGTRRCLPPPPEPPIPTAHDRDEPPSNASLPRALDHEEPQLTEESVPNARDDDELATTAQFPGARPWEPEPEPAPYVHAAPEPPCMLAAPELPPCVPATPQPRRAATGKRFKWGALALVPIAAAAVAILHVRGEAAMSLTPVARPAAAKHVPDVEPAVCDAPARDRDVPSSAVVKIDGRDVPSQAVVKIDGRTYIIQVMVTPVTGSDELATRGP